MSTSPDVVTPPACAAREAVTPDAVVELVDATGRRVHGLLDALRVTVEDRFADGRTPARSDLHLAELAGALLRLPGLPLVGAGFVAARGVLADVPYWLDWWTTDPDVEAPAEATVERLAVQTDPRADDFRDYTALAWFVGPRDSGRPCLTGPYVDYLCTDEYTLTFTQPARPDGRFVGVVGADLHVRRLEVAVLPTMARLPQPSTLVSTTGRVVTSSGTGWVTGDLVREVPVAAWCRDGVDGDERWRLLPCSSVPLALLLPR